MPYKVIKHKDGTVTVVNAETGKVHAYRTTEKKAQIQIRIMENADKKQK